MLDYGDLKTADDQTNSRGCSLSRERSATVATQSSSTLLSRRGCRRDSSRHRARCWTRSRSQEEVEQRASVACFDVLRRVGP